MKQQLCKIRKKTGYAIVKTVMACIHQLPHFHQWIALQESLYHPSLTLYKHMSVNYCLKDLGQVQIPVPPSHLHGIYQGSRNQQDKQQPRKGKLFGSFHEPIMMTNVQPHQTHTFSDQTHFVHRSQSTSHTHTQ
jgi:hypothetical protein